MKHVLKAVLAIGLAAMVQGCIGTIGRYSLAREAPEGHAALNDAYGRAVNGQILLNVMRSRDRWPRHYVDVPAMNDSPSVTVRATGILNPLNLNNAADPYRASQLQGYREEVTRPGYGVAPYNTEAVARALTPTQRRVFDHYWNSGWSRDVVMFVMVASISRLKSEVVLSPEMLAGSNGQIDPGSAAARLYWLEPIYNGSEDHVDCAVDPLIAGPGNTISGNDTWTWPEVDPGRRPAGEPRAPDAERRCAFFNIVHMINTYGATNVRLREEEACRISTTIPLENGNAALITGIANAVQRGREMSVRLPRATPARTQAAGQPPAPATALEITQCQPEAEKQIILEVFNRQDGALTASYLITPRSLDDMVYAMGSLLRADNRSIARAPDCRSNCRLVPLFTVTERRVNAQHYAAVALHAGTRYYAGPIVTAPNEENAYGDRTGTVLTLLAQLFALNHSPGALGALPPRVVVN